MTEKQGGSDLRANSTIAEPIGDGWFELTGHKWFCTHPVFEVFFTLAQTDAGITCFVAERPHPGFRMQRLKDKLGGRCLASSEVEYDHLPARILGEEGRGTAFIVEQLIWTRLDTLTAVAGMMRRVVAEAIWHARHRAAFGAPLAAAAGDGERARRHRARVRGGDGRRRCASRARSTPTTPRRPPSAASRSRSMKYWVCKRGAPLAAEALECLGGNGYVEEAPMAQFYRDIQLGTVWEGSGNVIALDVLRALASRARGSDRVPRRVRRSPPAPTRASTRTCCACARGSRRSAADPAPAAVERSPRRRGHGARAAGEPAAAPRAAGRRPTAFCAARLGRARSRVRRPAARRRRRGDRRARARALTGTAPIAPAAPRCSLPVR